MSLRYASLKDVPAHLLTGHHAPNVPVAQTKRAKYGNKSVWIDGKRFDSKLEGRCYEWLTLRWKAGDVAWFTRQVPFELPGGVVYRADFVAALRVGGVEVIDSTGVMTPTKRNKLKQVKAVYGIDVTLWTDKA